MNLETAPQFAAVYAEAAIAYIETSVPQAVLWLEDEERWDFMPGDEELEPSLVAFILESGWDAQLSLLESTDINADDYDSRALRDEIEQYLDQEGYARAFIESLMEKRRLVEEDGDEPRDDQPDEVEPD